MNENYKLSDQVLSTPVKNENRDNQPSLNSNTIVKVEFEELLRDNPEVDNAFFIKLKSGKREWFPYSLCEYKNTTLFVPLWLYERKFK